MGIAYNTAIVLIGTSLLGACCGLLGTFAVLRRRALLGDALAHATLPGVGFAFLLWPQREVVWLLSGALATGLLGVYTVLLITRFTRLKEDAAIAAVLGVFVSAGFVLIQYIEHHSASGNQAGLASYIMGKTAGMIAQDVYWIAGISTAALLLLLLLYKELKVVTFDASFAQVQGWPALRIDLLLAALVALTVVVGLLAVGAILITALLIVPAVVARFWTHRLSILLLLAAICGAVMGGIGTTISAQTSFTPAGPLVVLVGAALFVGSALLAPERGVLARWSAARRFRQRLAEQRLLISLWQADQESSAARLDAVPPRGAHRLQASRQAAADRLALQGLVRSDSPSAAGVRLPQLTEMGRQRAARVVRGQRLLQLALLHYPELTRQSVELDLEGVDTQLPPAVIAELDARFASSAAGASRGGGH